MLGCTISSFISRICCPFSKLDIYISMLMCSFYLIQFCLAVFIRRFFFSVFYLLENLSFYMLLTLDGGIFI